MKDRRLDDAGATLGARAPRRTGRVEAYRLGRRTAAAFANRGRRLRWPARAAVTLTFLLPGGGRELGSASATFWRVRPWWHVAAALIAGTALPTLLVLTPWPYDEWTGMTAVAVGLFVLVPRSTLVTRTVPAGSFFLSNLANDPAGTPGAGRTLLDQLIAEAAAHGGRTYLEVDTRNTDLFRFYSNARFTPVSPLKTAGKAMLSR